MSRFWLGSLLCSVSHSHFLESSMKVDSAQAVPMMTKAQGLMERIRLKETGLLSDSP